MRIMKQIFSEGFILLAVGLCSLWYPLNEAQAAMVSYSFTGSVDTTAPPIVPVFGSFQFDNATGSSGGAYTGAVKNFNLTIVDGRRYTSSFTAGANAVTISQNMPLGGGVVDRWALVSAATGPQFGDFTPFLFDFRLDRLGGGLFANTDLQNPPSFSTLSLSPLTAARWRLFFEDVDGNPAVFLGSITSLTTVPLPTAVLLFGAGLVSLVGLGAGGLRNLRRSQA